jgi:hypothetical protein
MLTPCESWRCGVKVLMGTGALLGEGFDCRELSTLFLTTPIKFNGRLLQYLGRVLRPAPGKDAARRMEWRAYRLETNHFVKIAIMRNIIALHEKLAKLLQGIGLINKVPDRLSVTSKINFKDDDVRPAYYKFLFLAREREEESPAF